MYAIFRVWKAYKSLNAIKGYAAHALRLMETLNADDKIQNRILIGTKDIVKDFQEYIKPVKKIRSNAVLGRDLLLTASPDWFQRASPSEIDIWVSKNMMWLNENFGDNIRFACLHRDEKTIHITALMVPRFYSKERGHYLANHLYFDGIEKMRAWQDKYSEAMQEFNLERGIRGSKATHLNIKKFYSLISETFDELDEEAILAKARDREIMKKELEELKETVKYVDKERTYNEEFANKLSAAYEKLEQDAQFYKALTNHIIKAHHVTEKEVNTFINSLSNSRERGEIDKT